MDRLHAMIDAAGMDNNWYSVSNQKKYTFAIATSLVVEHGMGVDEALDIANSLCTEFFHRHINPNKG